MLYPRRKTRTQQRQLRRDVRGDLGTSGDTIPDLRAQLSAARSLGAMLDNESNGRFGIAIHDFKTGEAIPVGTAIEMFVDARRGERELVEKLRAQYAEEAVS